MSAILYADGYKMFHPKAMHKSIEAIYENFTSRSGKLSNIPNSLCGDRVVCVGMQRFLMSHFVERWNQTFFMLDKSNAIRQAKRILDAYFSSDYDMTKFEELHDLGYLPIRVKSLEEGTLVPYGVPMFTMTNTVNGFGWLVGTQETIVSTENWPLQTSATTATAYMVQTKSAMQSTGMDLAMLPFMNHDFQFRGNFGQEAAKLSGLGHLMAGHAGTDTLVALLDAEKYYGADVETELVGCSVPATEHAIATSWMAIYAKENDCDLFDAEIAFMNHLMDIVPEGIVSHVSDSYDFWRIVEEGLPLLKDRIMQRKGTFVIRPDSGDPVKVLTGYRVVELDHIDDIGVHWNDGYEAGRYEGKTYEIELYVSCGVSCARRGRELCEAEVKGLIQCLWETFGGTWTDVKRSDRGGNTTEHYKLLHDTIGAIYGDAITLDRQAEINERLKDKHFCPSMVLGIGSYSYQYATRDTHGSAIKATCAFVEGGKQVDFGKDPKTDPNKKSAKGLLRVDYDDQGVLTLFQNQTPEQEQQGLLRVVFEDGKLYNKTTLRDIRAKIASQI